MKIGPCDGRDRLPAAAPAPQPATEKTTTEKKTGGGDDVTISPAARKLAAETGPDGVKTTEPTDRSPKADDYDRPEIRSTIAGRIADEMLKESSARKENDTDHDIDDNRERGS